MPGLRWVRLQVEVDCNLRRGAWYRVVNLQRSQAVVDVNQKSMPVPLFVLEISNTPPKRWTVVPAPHGMRRLPKEFVPMYAVCPNCRERVPLPEDAETINCTRCRNTYDVAWDEEYLGGY